MRIIVGSRVVRGAVGGPVAIGAVEGVMMAAVAVMGAGKVGRVFIVTVMSGFRLEAEFGGSGFEVSFCVFGLVFGKDGRLPSCRCLIHGSGRIVLQWSY